MRKQATKLIINLSGGKENFHPEHRLLNFILLISFLLATMATLVNVLLGLNILLIATIFLGTMFFGFLYYLSRVRMKFAFARSLSTVSGFVFLDLMWFFNSGSNGPILYLMLVFYTMLIYIWDGKKRIAFIAVIFANTLCLFLIELYYEDLFLSYESRKIQIIDIYASFFMFIGVAIFIMVYAKSLYVREKVNAQKSDRLKSAFLANMSHEIRTPMNAIIGFASLINTGISDDKLLKYKNIINKNGEFLLRLIEDIIDISKIEADNIEIHKDVFSLDILCEDVFSTMALQLKKMKKEKLQLIYRKNKGKSEIFSDRMRIRQILVNLLSNAIKFTDEGVVEYGFTIKKDRVDFYVKDTGIGIEKDQQELIFERFMKIDNENSNKFRGTGLGLAICKNLVQKMGGDLGLKSEPNKGTEFFFNIPMDNALL